MTSRSVPVVNQLGMHARAAAKFVHLAGRFAADPSLAVLSMQVVDPDGGPGARWHVPRLRAGDPERSSVVTTFLGGACAIRRSAYLEAGGLPDLFFYGHEETDLAWRLMDRGYRLEYDATARMCHHTLPNARHSTFRRQDGRNRVLLAAARGSMVTIRADGVDEQEAIDALSDLVASGFGEGVCSV